MSDFVYWTGIIVVCVPMSVLIVAETISLVRDIRNGKSHH